MHVVTEDCLQWPGQKPRSPSGLGPLENNHPFQNPDNSLQETADIQTLHADAK